MALKLLIALLILVVPLELPGCGPFFEATEFKVGLEPEAPDQFVRGTLGILQPSYARLYQVVAYRYLMGVGLNDAERRAVLPPAPAVNSARVAYPPVGDSPETPWLAARNRVPGVQPLHSVDVYRQVKKDNYFDTYVNCNADAFRAAASTLERIRRAGKPEEWIAAQDIVFEDCSKGTQLPPPVSDSRFAPDRAYQIASAKFYMEQYDDARQDFQTIAANPSSPWHDIAPYLAARCLIRKGKLAEAETELEHIASDPALTRWHAAAESLLGYVRAHLNPTGRMHEIALALARPDSQASIGKDLADYRFLFDQQVKPDPGDDLTDWILSFQAGGFGASEKWHEHPTLPWLLAALQSAKPGDDAVQGLMIAASQVKSDSPAYLTVNYHRVRLLPAAEGRDLAARLLSTKMGTSDRNLLRAQRMRLAVDFEDFLRFAPRTVVGKPPTSLGKLDDDSAEILDRVVPLDLLKQASSSPLLPVETRNRLRRVVAVRALVLASTPNFDEVFRVLQTPGDAPYVQSDSYPRGGKPADMDVYRDNWWCAGSKRNFFVETPSGASALVPSFVPTGLSERAARERKKLADLPAGPSWLGAQTIAFAEQHPQDLRVPEALYRVVRASRLGCTDEHTGDFSKRAFDLLHHRYPASEWTKKTPYWYK